MSEAPPAPLPLVIPPELVRHPRPAGTRDWISLTLAISALLHLLALAAWILLFKPVAGKAGAPEDAGVQMVFDTQQPNAAPTPSPATPPSGGEPPPQVNLQGLDEAITPTPPIPSAEDGEVMPLPAARPTRTRRASQHSDNPFASATFLNMPRSTLTAPPSGARRQASHPIVTSGFVTGSQTHEGHVNLSIGGNYGDWGDEVSQWVMSHLYYPENAADNNEDGTVSVMVTVARDGSVTNVRLLRSSVFRALDIGLLDVFIKKHMPPFPPGMTQDHVDLPITVDYVLIRQ